MAAYGQSNPMGAYRSVAAHGGAATEDPHRLIWMLMDGALDRIAKARGLIERGEKIEKAALLHRTVAIVDELKSSLDFSVGGEIALNLERLYAYMIQQLNRANLESRVDLLDEVAKLLRQIRDAWVSLPRSARDSQKVQGLR